MPHWLTALLVLSSPPGIQRDSYGVPQVRAGSDVEAVRLMGQAVAEDRLWQMELSRRMSRSRLAEVLGPSAAASDVTTFKMGYSDQELGSMLARLRPKTRLFFEAYAKGVNETISRREARGTLPKEYASYGISPEPWTVLDSAAIGVRLARLFGTGGAGELRNYLLTIYLKGQKASGQVLNVVDDLAWINDPLSPTTVDLSDDPLAKRHPTFLNPTRAESERHLALLPPSNLFELFPAVRLASHEAPKLVAEANSLPYKTGSYAILVGGKRSMSGRPLLLGGPQMGHTNPSVVHEISIQSPELNVTGMNVPGIPGVLIGTSPTMAWTLTSGVADVTDIFFHKKVGPNQYLVDGQSKALRTASKKIVVRGGPVVDAFRARTELGPVVLDSSTGQALYSERSAFWQQELDGIEFLWDLTRAKTGAEAMKLSTANPLSFNFFFAAANGDIGWRYCGKVPLRAPGLDPRFPTPAGEKFDWKGFIPQDLMPHVLNPKSGMISNWNNKPATWWANGDTPVWGKHFRVTALRTALPPGKVSITDLERAIFRIARQEEGSWRSFLPVMRAALRDASLDPIERLAAGWLTSYDGYQLVGSRAAQVYNTTLAELKQELFVPLTGNFTSAANLNTVVQSSLLDRALRGQTKTDFLAERKAHEVILAGFRLAVTVLKARQSDPYKWGLELGGIRVPDGSIVPYAARGTYIQIVEWDGKRWSGRAVASPGVAEAGAHSNDQVVLAREWRYKPMWTP